MGCGVTQTTRQENADQRAVGQGPSPSFQGATKISLFYSSLGAVVVDYTRVGLRLGKGDDG